MGTPVLSIYWNTLVYLDKGSFTSGQLKNYRLHCDGGSGFEDELSGGTPITGRGNSLFQHLETGFPANINRIWSPGSAGTNLNLNSGGSALGMVRAGRWVRHEIWVVPGTPGSANGSISWRFVDTSDGTVLASGTHTNVQFLGSTDAGFTRFTIQQYMGNGLEGDGVATYVDGDIHVAYSTADTSFPQSVVMGDASTWAACTKYRSPIQRITSRSSSLIAGKFNKGVLTGVTPGVDIWAYVLNGVDSVLNSSGIVPVAA
jgi:hypothetical protein